MEFILQCPTTTVPKTIISLFFANDRSTLFGPFVFFHAQCFKRRTLPVNTYCENTCCTDRGGNAATGCLIVYNNFCWFICNPCSSIYLLSFVQSLLFHLKSWNDYLRYNRYIRIQCNCLRSRDCNFYRYRRYQMVVMVMYSTFLSVCYYIITETQGSFEYARIPAYRCPEEN